MRFRIAAIAVVVLTQNLGTPAHAVRPVCDVPSPALGQAVTCTQQGTGFPVAVPSGALTMVATVKGAGGGGGGAAGSGIAGAGSNGAKVVATITVAGLTSISVTVGLGGPKGTGDPLTSGQDGGASIISSGAGSLITAGAGKGGGSAAHCGSGLPGSAATGSSSIADNTVIDAAGGSAGGAAGSPGAYGTSSDGTPGSDGWVTFTFYGVGASGGDSGPSPSTPASRSITWGGRGSGSASSALTEGTWENTPSASEWTLPGHVLLGWATDPAFPVAIAERSTGAYDGVIDGRRMIFIPAGKPTFVSGDAALHAIWAPEQRAQLIGRC